MTLSTSSAAPASSPEAEVARPPLLYRVTVVQVLFAALTLAMLAVRLVNLGVQPLAPVEASTALRAWLASQGLQPALDAGIPLLFSLETLFFFLAGAGSKTWPQLGDAFVRVWPVLASAATLWILYDWRRWAGDKAAEASGDLVALVAAVLFALSPLANAYGRRGDGVALVLMGLALAVAGWGRLQQQDSRGWTLAAVGAGIALISGPYGASALLALAVLALLSWRDVRGWPRPSITDGVVLVGVLLVGGTAFFSHVRALGLAALNWSEWLGAFALAPTSWWWGAIRLVLDEPFLVPVGVVATLWLLNRPGPARTLGLAALVMMAPAILQGPEAAGTRAVVALLFTVPAAVFVLAVLQRLDLLQPETLLYVVVSLLLLVVAFQYLVLSLQNPESIYVTQVVVALAAAVVLGVLFGFFLGHRTVLVHAAFVLVFILFFFNLAVVHGLGFDPLPPGFGALYAKDGRAGLRDLATTIGDLSEKQKGERWALPVALVAGSKSDDTLRWYLRQVPDLQVVHGVDPASAPPLVIAPGGLEVPLTDRYSGQQFVAWDNWKPADGDTRQLLTWALFRTAPWNLATDKVVLWADSSILTPSTAAP